MLAPTNNVSSSYQDRSRTVALDGGAILVRLAPLARSNTVISGPVPLFSSHASRFPLGLSATNSMAGVRPNAVTGGGAARDRVDTQRQRQPSRAARVRGMV